MRVLISTLTPYPSGTAHVVHITATARGFVDAGHETMLVPAQRGPGWPAAPGGGTAEPELPFRVHTLAGRDYRGMSLVNAPRLRRLAARARPDLCFADDVRSGLALTSGGHPTIVELHTLHLLSSRLSRIALRGLLQRPSLRRIITISEQLRDDLVARTGVDASRVRVVPEAARPRADAELDADPPAWLRPHMRPGALQVGFTGSLYTGRGAELLTTLARRLPDIDVHLAGGPADAVDELRAAPDLPPNLHVHGLRPLADAEALQVAVDVLIAPYSTYVGAPGGVDISRWFSPMKMFEYLASGRPMVCADLPVLREVLTDGRTALLVEPSDTDAWVSAIARLRDDPALRASIGAAGRALHAERHTWEARTAALIAAADLDG